MVQVIIIDKSGDICENDFSDKDDLQIYKKCNFRKTDHFNQQALWNIKVDGKKYKIKVFARNEGKHNQINKFEFPPPIDNILFYGSCAVIAYDNSDNKCNLDKELWDKCYEKLFGGFESLADTAEDDEKEEDELKNVPKEMKTKSGYLKDSFIADDEENEEIGSFDDDNDLISSNENQTETDEESDHSNMSELSHDDYIIE